MGLQEVQTLEDDREGLTLLEMSPVEPILTVVMPDQNLMANMNIMGTELLSSNDILPDNVTEEVEAIDTSNMPQYQVVQESCTKTCPPKKKTSTPRRPRAKKEVSTQQGPECDTNNSLLACMVCNKNFVSISRLKSHEKTHTKSRPFVCTDCGKTFTVRYSLICHMRVHTRERPYICGTCGARFSQASSLKTHQIYKHTKEFPYACKICARGFISPGQRHEHVIRTHEKIGGNKKDSNSSQGKGRKKRQSSPAKQSNVTTSQLPNSDNDDPFVHTINGSNDQEVQTNLTLAPVF